MSKPCFFSTRASATALAIVFSPFLLAPPLSSGKPAAWIESRPEPAPLAALSMSGDPQAETDGWRKGPNLARVHDEWLDQTVWEHTGGRHGWIRSADPLPANFVIEARVRVQQRGHGITLSIGAEGVDTQPGYAYAISYVPAGERSWRVTTFHHPSDAYREALSNPAEGLEASLQHTLNSIPGRMDFRELHAKPPSPLSEENFRREIEAALNARPEPETQWIDLKISCSRGHLRMWANGVFVGERKPCGSFSGDAHVKLDRSVRLASLVLRPALETADTLFETVPLSERLNARAAGGHGPAALHEQALPTNRNIHVEDIPFVFRRHADSRDHVDLGASLFRERNRPGHFMARITWPDPQMLDPARIMFTVPNRAYARLWLIAAFDETPGSVPLLTARFFKPKAGFPIDADIEVPALTARSAPGQARRLPVTKPDGSEASLWLVPIELDAARIGSEMRDLPKMSLELTQEVHPYRGFPDPANYGWFQGGRPSGVRVFAMTLEKAPVRMIASGNRFGNVYVAPEKPIWQVDLFNQLPQTVEGRIRLAVTDPYETRGDILESPFTLSPDGAARFEFPLETELNGLHIVRSEVTFPETEPGGWFARVFGASPTAPSPLSRRGTFLQLPPDTRRATQENSPWGIFSWDGGHGTHKDMDDIRYLLRAAGARRGAKHPEADDENDWGLQPRAQHIGNDQRSAQPWAFEDPYDPEKYAQNRDQIGKRIAERSQKQPDTPSWSMFIETAITKELTYGMPRRYIGEDPTWTEEEARRVRGHMIYGKAVCEGIREHAPDAGIALGWAGALFTIPLLESGFPRELFDFIGADVPVFERTPEMPLREVTANQMWPLGQAMKEYGYADVPVIHSESYYPSSHPLALGWRRSADHYVRLHTLSLAMIPNTIFSGTFSLQDCSSYWGSQHYGEHGLVGRQPEANPKPAFAAYATMTRLLDPGEYQGYLQTGSHSVYALHFTSNGRNVYPLWTLRGRREARLSLPNGANAVRVDESGNEFPLAFEEGQAAVSLTPTPLWIVSDTEISKVSLGATEPDFVRSEHPLIEDSFGANAAQYRPENQVSEGAHRVLLDTLETPWKTIPGPYPAHAEGHWAMARYDGPMRSETVQSEERQAPVWQITLQEPDVQRELAAWYGTFDPPAPIRIPGKARALGVWVDGRSNWGRIVYEVVDAEGETWRSIGTKDDWNCDDIHTWSYFNFDGWRYLEFPLPSHLPHDNYREHDTTWWGSDGGDGVVQLPLTLKRLVIEQRTHNLYVNEIVAVEDRSVRLHRLTAVYDNATAMTDAPIEAQRAAAGNLRSQWEAGARALPNPIAALRENGTGEPTAFATVAPPDDISGLVTRLDIGLEPIEDAREYRLYVSAYPDGSGAMQIAKGGDPFLTVSRLQPGFPLYLFATYVDAENRESKPTPSRRILLVDDFPFK